MTTKCQKNIATVVKIKSYNSKSGLIFTIRPKFKRSYGQFSLLELGIQKSKAKLWCQQQKLTVAPPDWVLSKN